MGGLEAVINEQSGQAVGMVDDAYGHILGFAKAATGSGGSLAPNNLTSNPSGSTFPTAANQIYFEWHSARFTGYGPQAGNWSPSIEEGVAVWRTFGWRGKRMEVTGFYHLGARYYEPNSGRFLSPDPMGHGASMGLYDYAGGDPINFVDPRGRYAQSGHFYTVYAVALGAGVPQEKAFRLAYYAQLPDQVDEFDASAAYKGVLKQDALIVGKNYANAQSFGLIPGASAADMQELRDRNDHLVTIQAGLHSLLPGGATNAQINAARTNLAYAINSGSLDNDWQVGFAIHALGDAFAHTMDPSQKGSIKWNSNQGLGSSLIGYPLGLGHGADGHLPDHITASPANLEKYGQYVGLLYTALGGQGNPSENTDIAELLKVASGIPSPKNRWVEDDVDGKIMNDWFVGKYGADALYGYDPRPEHSVLSSMTTPSMSAVNDYSTRIQGIMSSDPTGKNLNIIPKSH